MIVNNAIFTASAAATAAVDCHECSSKMLFPEQCSLENESRLFVDFVNVHHCVRECGVDKMHFVIQQCFFFHLSNSKQHMLETAAANSGGAYWTMDIYSQWN